MININNLSEYSKNELLNLWSTFPKKQKPPTAIKTLMREVAYRLQEQEYGKLDKNTTVSLRRHITVFSKALKNGERQSSTPTAPSQTALELGVIIKKRWQGEQCLVKVLGKRSFEYNGQIGGKKF